MVCLRNICTNTLHKGDDDDYDDDDNNNNNNNTTNNNNNSNNNNLAQGIKSHQESAQQQLYTVLSAMQNTE